MNYLNITAILARVYLYAGELEKAYHEAQYVLDFQGISFPSKYGGYSGNSKSRDDILLAFFNKKISETFEAYTGGESGYLKLKNLDELYIGETADKRYTEMVKEVSKSVRMSAKYIKYTDNSNERINGPLIPVLRKAEMSVSYTHLVTSHLSFGVTMRALGMFEYQTDKPFSAVVKRSLILLPEQPMQPRLLDPRIGVFYTGKMKFTNDDNGSDVVYYAHRWRIEPKDMEAYKRGELVDAKRPITFYVDPNFPQMWIKYLRMGVELSLIHIYMEVVVSVIPSANCLKLLNIMTKINELNCNRK